MNPFSRLIISYAITLHLIWAGLVLGWPDQIQATPLNFLLFYIRWPVLTFFLIGVAGWAAYGSVYGAEYQKPWRRILHLIPQQVVLIVSAYAALWAVFSGHYADGTIRHWAFILADQVPQILVAIFHTAAIVGIAKNRI